MYHIFFSHTVSEIDRIDQKVLFCHKSADFQPIIHLKLQNLMSRARNNNELFKYISYVIIRYSHTVSEICRIDQKVLVCHTLAIFQPMIHLKLHNLMSRASNNKKLLKMLHMLNIIVIQLVKLTEKTTNTILP